MLALAFAAGMCSVTDGGVVVDGIVVVITDIRGIQTRGLLRKGDSISDEAQSLSYQPGTCDLFWHIFVWRGRQSSQFYDFQECWPHTRRSGPEADHSLEE